VHAAVRHWAWLLKASKQAMGGLLACAWSMRQYCSRRVCTHICFKLGVCVGGWVWAARERECCCNVWQASRGAAAGDMECAGLVLPCVMALFSHFAIVIKMKKREEDDTCLSVAAVQTDTTAVPFTC
jgi:hypothetical protein